MAKKTDILLASACGILLVLGFPPIDLYPIAWIAIVPLLVALREKNIRTSFFLGMLTGFVYFLGTTYWVYNSMYVYGHLPAILSVLALILLCLYLSLYVGIFSALFNFLSKNPVLPAVFAVPVLWVTLEFLRTYALTGFPWSLLGYSQYKFLSLIQIADITGIYGISFLVAALNGGIYDIAFNRPERTSKISQWSKTLGIIIYVIIIIISLSYGMGKIKEDGSEGKIRVSVIQGNIEQDKKWDPEFQREVIDTYKRLTMEVIPDHPDMIVWPESALPFVFGYDEALTREITTFQKGLNTYLLFGSVLLKKSENGRNMLSNSALLLSPEGYVVSIYDKIHLVPYGEYVPLRDLFPFIEKLVVAIGDFMPGKETVVMQTPFAKIGNLICYEIIFPGLVRKFVDNGANLLVTITNDAWFGRTSAPYQHFSMAVFRAVENRVPVVRSANTGISGFIDSRGRIIKKSDIFVEAAFTEEISAGREKSFYSEYGDIFAYFCLISTALLITVRFFAGRKAR